MSTDFTRDKKGGIRDVENEARILLNMYAPLKSLPKKIEASIAKLSKTIAVCERARERKVFLRSSKLALMEERNVYLRKLRIIEEYGRRNNWGVALSNHPASEPSPILQRQLPGAKLLYAVYTALYRVNV
jgi:hypothetical protein